MWDEWESWSTCSRTCGDGFKVRIRTIKTKEENNGNECSGSFTEHDMCHTSTPCGNMDISKTSIIYILGDLNILDSHLFLHFHYFIILYP